MKTLYLECAMGAAGDMLMGALLELHPNPAEFLEELNGLGIPGVTVRAERSSTQGIAGTHIRVLVNGQEEEASHHDHHGHHGHHDHHDHHDHHHHPHAGIHEITHVIEALALPEPVRRDALAVYGAIAQAEARAHGVPVTEVHFHEVGALDAVTDVVGVCLLLHRLEVEEILASPVHVGSGTVQCAHGVLPVPAPATEFLLEGIPTYGGEIQGELCTPTGAALLRHFVKQFGARPLMAVERVGCGLGSQVFPRANCLRALLGGSQGQEGRERIYQLSCNLDDMTPEELACGMEVLRQAGALEVYTTGANMKKGRPGVVLSCICHEERRQELVGLMFRHFTTLGIREQKLSRYVLHREVRAQETELGTVHIKTASGWGVFREKPELEDLRAIAQATGRSVREVGESLRVLLQQ